MYANLKLQIWKSGMRQNRIAQLLGMDETVLSKIVNGFRAPTESVRVNLAAVLHSDEAWLFQWDGEGAPGAPERSEGAGAQRAASAQADAGGVPPSGRGGLR